MERGLQKEAELFGELVVTDVSKKLITSFLARLHSKKTPA
jgi:hypothetical protein